MKLLKRISTVFLAVSMLPFMAYATEQENSYFGDAQVIYVAPDGNDSGKGTIESPLATMDGARKKAQSKTKDKDIYVAFRGGTYTVRDSVKFGVEDSGSESGRIIYTSYPGEEAVFNGGTKVTGWSEYKDGIYVADVAEAENFRELYVDGVRQPRAAIYIQGLGFDDNQTAVSVLTDDLPETVSNQECLETLNTYKWRQYWLPVERLFQEGEYTKIYYDTAPIQLYTSKFNFEWNGKTYIRLENAIEFLDEEGEWYFDKYTKKLYYKPVNGVDINACEIYVPVAEKFIEINGQGVSQCVENIEFRNLKFMYAGYTRTSEEGHLTVQASTMVTSAGAYGAMTPGHINGNFVRNVEFNGNTIAHTAITGINLENGIFDTKISGNAFYDIGFSAVTVGSTKHSVARQSEVPDKISINNNVVKNAGCGYWCAAAITIYFTTNSEVVHNHIQNTTYTAISIGGSYKKNSLQHDNLVGYNKLQNMNMKVIDGAGIYSMGENRNSAYTGNYVSGINAPFNSAALYHDENSAGYIDTDNVVDVENETYLWYNLNNSRELEIYNTYTNTNNIVTWKCNDIKIYNTYHVENDEWPERALEIMENSGPTDEYSEVYDKLATVDKNPGGNKPILSALNTIYDEANSFLPIHHNAVADEDIKAPYKEENGEVVIDAFEYNGDYVGYEENSSSFLTLLRNEARTKNNYSRATLVSQPCTYTQFNVDLQGKEPLPQNPMIGYKINFSTPGKYRIFVRMKADSRSDNGLSVYLGDDKVGTLPVEKTYIWHNKTIEGESLILNIEEPGIHQVILRTKKTNVFIDRIWITQNPSEDLLGGKDITGPIASRRDSDTAVYIDVPIKKAADELPKPLQERVNVALKKPATASSFMTKNGISYQAKNGVNGNFVDDWYTEDSAELPWWQVDLEKKYKITEMGLIFRTSANQATTRRYFEVLASNDPEFKTYTKLHDSGSTTVGYRQELKLCFDMEEEYQFIRIRKTVKEYFGIAECRVYSEDNIELKSEDISFSSDKKGKFGVDKAVDGDLSTCWSEGSKKDYRVKFKNDSGMGVSKVKVYIRNDVMIPELFTDFELRGSDDKDFKSYTVLADKFTKEGNVLTASVTDPNSYKYIMLVKKQGFVGIAEIKTYMRGLGLSGTDVIVTETN